MLLDHHLVECMRVDAGTPRLYPIFVEVSNADGEGRDHCHQRIPVFSDRSITYLALHLHFDLSLVEHLIMQGFQRWKVNTINYGGWLWIIDVSGKFGFTNGFSQHLFDAVTLTVRLDAERLHMCCDLTQLGHKSVLRAKLNNSSFGHSMEALSGEPVRRSLT